MSFDARFKTGRTPTRWGWWSFGLLLAAGLALLSSAPGLRWRSKDSADPPGDSPQNQIRIALPTNGIPALVRDIVSTSVVDRVTSPPPTSIIVTAAPPVAFVPRPPSNTLELQVALARRGVSAGPIDGALGPQTRAALRAFQKRERLPVTGAFDNATRLRLSLTEPFEQTYTVSSNDLARLSPVGPTWLAKSQQRRLDFENPLEMLAEKSHAHPNLIRALNPAVNWSNVVAETAVTILHVQFPPLRRGASTVRIRLSERTLQAFDAESRLLAHFPCSIARRVEKRPLGQLQVEELAYNPTYRFDPDIFPESAEARRLRRPLTIPPGPNNPVGTAWIGLNRPGYGIHGTPRPEEVGRTESHGCFRLSNWDAEYLAQMVRVGTPVIVEP